MKKNCVLASLMLLFFSGFSQIGFNVDVLPTNVGGKAEFKRVFDQELIYPKDELLKMISGKVVISFNILKDSSVSEIKIKELTGPTPESNLDFEKEAMRIFRKFQWVPAVKGGNYVSTNWDATFNFEAEKYKKICRERDFVEFKYLPKMKVDTSIVIHKTADQMPMYPKGTFALQDFIKENLEYPKQAQLSNIQGTVIVHFIVEPSGLPTNIGVIKSIGGGCDQEATRIAELIKWYPAKIGETLVRAEMSLPIYFVLNEDFKDNSAGEQK